MNEKNKKDIETEKIEAVPERGSLGLLALGAVGLKAWRQKRQDIKEGKEKS
jgi:hypothetical protein